MRLPLLSSPKPSRVLRAVLAAGLLATVAGCSAPSDPYDAARILGSFQDADMRVANETAGDHEFTLNIPVPISADRLLVKAIYSSDRQGSFVLKSPDGNGAKFDTFLEPRQKTDDNWFRERDPFAGRWQLSGHLTHGGAYAFGVYID